MKVFRLCFFILISSMLQAQDIHFSQFYNSPLTLNAANTGLYEGDFRFANTYRSQWSKLDPGYRTNAFSFDKTLYTGADEISGGLLFIYDRSGINRLQSIRLGLSAAYHRTFGVHSISAGFQWNYIFKSIDRSKITMPEQFNMNTGYFDPSMPSGEMMLDEKRSFGDVNAGLIYQVELNKHFIQAGASFFHLNKPGDTFFNSKNKLPIRTCITVSDKIGIGNDYLLHARILMMQQVKANEYVGGVTLAKQLSNGESKFTEINGGLYVRTAPGSGTDAVIPVIGIKYDLFDIALSYDINISSLHTATASRGGFEISLIYTALSSRLFKIKIPCERY
ncbi:MAG TPA: PorP/SprF family type IX secretion system membrane protein [Bacteroidia bacterium]|jgi:type IX secretion system PorP/SprF family membrane protein|nr:PorP/SprF family type IX secretion system membrane protein [Bacteroidia bacterium]HMU18579.1 PorP/SprF family type IX secretion system membrane protein [Bacteroidia bacterium]